MSVWESTGGVMTDQDSQIRQLFAQAALNEAHQLAVHWTEQKPGDVAAWQHRSHAEMWCGDIAAAEYSCRQVLALAPGSRRGLFNLATVLLAQGRLTEGWPLYEARYASVDAATDGTELVRFPYPENRRWRGEVLEGRRLLLLGEQGFGDQIQFARFITAARVQAAAAIQVQVPATLAGLFRSIPGVAEVSTGPVDDTGQDVWLPLLSLPHILGISALPAQALPYLHPVADRTVDWRSRMELWGKGKKRFGLVWAGNPGNVADTRRSLSLQQAFEIVGAGRGAMPVSLQLGAAGLERLAEQCQRGMLPLLDLLPDFSETAAALQALDLVITVDTAVAHLAGALGKPVWLLLPVGADWRWGISGASTPWYPTARLYRQLGVGDWGDPIRRLCADLHAWVSA